MDELNGRTRILVLPTENGKFGPLDGPFTLTIESRDSRQAETQEADILATIIDFVRHVARGVSCYNNNEFTDSSNLRSYSAECMAEIGSEAPEIAAKLDSLVVDCTRLPTATRSHPIWKLDRAILGALPGVTFVE